MEIPKQDASDRELTEAREAIAKTRPGHAPGQAVDSRASTLELEAVLENETAERKRLQRELEVRHCALDAATSHFLILDMAHDGRIVFVNRSVARNHGYEPAELIGKPPSFLVAAD